MIHSAGHFYETDAALAQYLLFHYGAPEQICPLVPAMRRACGFPVRCVAEPLAWLKPRLRSFKRALDLGCAVGRSSFELRRHFDAVIGLDFSARFIAAARAMQERRALTVSVPAEGRAEETLELALPTGLATDGIAFATGDAGALDPTLGAFDLVLLANLIDRLADPARCLAALPGFVQPGGWLVLTSPYTWLEEYTPRDRWLDGAGRGTLPALAERLAPAFALRHRLDLPFLIREHRRKFQWSVAEASLWERLA